MPDKNSFFNVWPKVVELRDRIAMPDTELIVTGHAALQNMIDGKQLPSAVWTQLQAAGDKLGYPLFLRTDLASGKHEYTRTCYVPEPEDLLEHIFRVVEFNEIAGVFGLPYEGLVLREYIELDARFLAFQGMPVAPEFRFFVRDGRVTCRHFYWPAESLARASAHTPPLPRTWRSKLRQCAAISGDVADSLCDSATLIAQALGGEWSLDFARAKDGRWLFIDAATYADSWHWPTCPNARSVRANTLLRTDRQGCNPS